jgi:hypothetical protein
MRNRSRRFGIAPRPEAVGAPDRKPGPDKGKAPLFQDEKNLGGCGNKPPGAALIVKRRAKPPSPSPSITRRRTPVASAAGVHSLFDRMRSWLVRHLVGFSRALGNSAASPPLQRRWRPRASKSVANEAGWLSLRISPGFSFAGRARERRPRVHSLPTTRSSRWIITALPEKPRIDSMSAEDRPLILSASSTS